jgi:hypothetical protein
MSRVAHEPTAETIAQVEALAGYGVRQDEIAVYLDVDPKTLRKHYREAQPAWLSEAEEHASDSRGLCERFLSSRIVYYPGAGSDNPG